jgi:hypothetical protein
MEQVNSLESLVGVWQRRSMRWPDGREDVTTRVWWVQALPHYADIRIPANRPSFEGVGSRDQCDPPRRNWISSQEGFAGILTRQDDAWIWQREFDLLTVRGRRDIGRLRFTDSTHRLMIEEGVDAPYVEVWERIDEASSGAAYRLDEGGHRGMLVVVGGHFLMALQRSGGTPLELSHGRPAGAMDEWIVTDSTFPWREGRRLLEGVFGNFIKT